jgi:hypothetical protein
MNFDFSNGGKISEKWYITTFINSKRFFFASSCIGGQANITNQAQRDSINQKSDCYLEKGN